MACNVTPALGVLEAIDLWRAIMAMLHLDQAAMCLIYDHIGLSDEFELVLLPRNIDKYSKTPMATAILTRRPARITVAMPVTYLGR